MCNFCDQVISKKIERIRDHLGKCKVKNRAKDDANEEVEQLETNAEKLLSPVSGSLAPGRSDSQQSISAISDCSASDISRSSTPALTKRRFRSGTPLKEAY